MQTLSQEVSLYQHLPEIVYHYYPAIGQILAACAVDPTTGFLGWNWSQAQGVVPACAAVGPELATRESGCCLLQGDYAAEGFGCQEARRGRRHRGRRRRGQGGGAEQAGLQLTRASRPDLDRWARASREEVLAPGRVPSGLPQVGQQLGHATWTDEERNPSSASTAAFNSPWDDDLGQAEDFAQDLESADESRKEDANFLDAVKDRLEQLEEGLEDDRKREQIFMWVQPVVWRLAVTRLGSRFLQKALERANLKTTASINLIKVITPSTVEDLVTLYESLHGNHVLTKFIESLDSDKHEPIRRLIASRGAAKIARHRCGCRVLERLLEHNKADQISQLLDQIVDDAEALSRHQYGNFVIQHTLEHQPQYRGAILEQLLQGPLAMHMLATHRTASHVVQRALDHCDDHWRATILKRMMHWVDEDGVQRSILDIATARYGSYVVVTLLSSALLRQLPQQGQRRLLGVLRSEEAQAILARSEHAKRVQEELAQRARELGLPLQEETALQ